jgi:CRISPR system Cascade subunit CasE
VWTLFGDDPDRRRDFLWREAEPGLFYLLSERPPEDHHALFRLDEAKRFAPELRPGDRLHFALRVNATVARRPDGSTGRGKPCDIVMDALYRLPKDARADDRRRLIADVAEKWLAKQGEKAGFRVASPARGEAAGALSMAAYRTLNIERSARPARIGVLDLEGDLEIQDSIAFVTALACGFGRAKAFGCGLMLVRRA